MGSCETCCKPIEDCCCQLTEEEWAVLYPEDLRLIPPPRKRKGWWFTISGENVPPCPSCESLRSRIRELEEEINGPFGYKETVEGLTNSVFQFDYEWEQGQMKLSEENTRLREAVEWACENVDDYCSAGQGVDYAFCKELRRRAGVEGR